MKNIVFINYALHLGGTDRVVAELSGIFFRHGYDVTVVTLRPAEEDFYVLDSGIPRFDLGVSVDDARRKGASYVGLSAIQALFRLRRLILDISPDVVISNWTSVNCFSLIALLGLRFPVVAYEHIHFSAPPLFWRGLRRLIYPLAAAVVTLTENDRLQLKKINKSTFKVKNPLTVRPSSVSGRSDRRILGVGRLVSQKGFDLLLKAFALVCEDYPDWSLDLVGDGPERENLEALAQRLGVSDKVFFHGAQSNVGRFYERASIFVLSSRFEGFGLVITEAQAYGVPVVAFDCPRGPSEIITNGSNGLLVKAEDVDGLAGAITKLIRDPGLADRIAAQGLSTVQEYSPESVLEQWVKILNAHL